MHCWARTLFIAVVVCLGTLSMLGACGQKGDLYLPEPSTKHTVPSGSDVPQVQDQPDETDNTELQPH